MFQGFDDIGWAGLLDIVFLGLLIYSALVWFKRTRTAFVLTGIVIVFGFYLLARQFNMVLTAALFEKFFAIILIAVVVIFQEELRHFFEQVAVLSFNPRLRNQTHVRPTREEVSVLARTLSDLAKERIGALIVLKGRDLLVRHLEGGVRLDGILGESVIKSLFDPHSMGHDGAVIIDKNRITDFAVHLPLSKNIAKTGKGGTRHAAALGLSELSDVMCLVVSEERGTLAVARHGNLEMVPDTEALIRQLDGFYQEIDPRKERRPWQDYFKHNSREKIVAFGLAIAFWLVFAYGAQPAMRLIRVPLNSLRLPHPWTVEVVEPKELELLFQGPRKAFYFWRQETVRSAIDIQREEGLQRIRISPKNFSYPGGVTLESVDPDEIKVRVVKGG